MASFPFYFIFLSFLASSSWQTLDPKCPSVPSITLHLTNMHMYTARVSTKPGGSRETFLPSPRSINGPWFASFHRLHVASPVPSLPLGRQLDQAMLGCLGTASQDSGGSCSVCSKGRYPGKRLTSTVGLDGWPNRSTACLGGELPSSWDALEMANVARAKKKTSVLS